ncbi:MAG: EamA-like transporter family protein [Candidatus Argoarchaeum ethanivorans]|uniref:EamA-like transporter family protein n=1 Tax=Candidatus Argoarchaeum ethanivorans TaxID=2608793 RepID=A0A811T603_9EURY|nr:MAG: EamA-like transporter family protein [Candidatus Argoarchaeum ethanivorans]
MANWMNHFHLEKNKHAAIYFLAGTSLFYGLLIVVQKMGLNTGINPISFSFFRSIMVVGISVIYYFSELKKLKYLNMDGITSLLILGTVSAVSIILLFIAQDSIPATNAGFLIRLTPLFVLPLAYILLKEKSSKKSILFMLTMLAGAYLLITSGTMIVPCSGVMLVVVVALMIAFQNVYAKKIMRFISAETVIFYRVLLSSLLVVIFVPVAWGVQSTPVTFDIILYSLITAVLYFLSVLCQYSAIKLIGPFLTSTFFLSGSLLSALFAYLLLGETLSIIQWVGAGGILLGGFLTIREVNKSDLKMPPDKTQ